MLTVDQIEPGIVVWLDADSLARDPRATDPGATGVRPFVCVDVGPGVTTWLALTSQDRLHHSKAFRRIPIHITDRTGGSATWRSAACYVRDVQYPLKRRDVVACEAAHADTWRSPGQRATVSARMVANLRQRIFATPA